MLTGPCILGFARIEALIAFIHCGKCNLQDRDMAAWTLGQLNRQKRFSQLVFCNSFPHCLCEAVAAESNSSFAERTPDFTDMVSQPTGTTT
jgi:hypothetical protein